ncbi:uncharacterized protein LOC123005684 [Tribolium madens]|uniref:uncharacterized protein LOC123005684 n=1 Tax=Tribolium madens TaxID=41895 RepID=UPI001CF74B07|nr:uncharacterized protein LOC123005684 [Tribolium madens]
MVPEFNDPFIILRKIFFNNCINYKITKFSNVLLIIIYSLVYCLQIYYMYKNFSINLLIKYGPITIFFLQIIVTAVFCVAMDKEMFEILTFFQKTCWPLNIIKKGVQIKLERKCQVISICLSCILILNIMTVIFNYPNFGTQRDFFICFIIFEEYFGEWSYIPCYFYFVGFLFLYFLFLKVCYIFVYGILEVQLQFLLIKEYLLEIYEFDHLKSWKYLQDVQYQQEMGKILRQCITHHNDLKKLVKIIMNVALKAMPFFLLFGVLLLISCFALIINFADTMSNIIKIRHLMFAINTFILSFLLCWIGQQLVDVTSNVFFTLAGAPWYYWNLKNIKILLTFMTNCTKNESINLAGICLDYNMFVSVLRISISYALVLYNLHKSSVI